MELDELWAPAGEQGVELSQDSDGEERGESGRATGEWILPVGGDLTPGSGIPGSRNDCSDLLADSMPALAICCISALARLLESFLNKEVLRRLSASRFLCLCLATFRLAILIEAGSLRRPPVLMDVVSKAVALSVTASPPDIRSWRT